MVTAWGSLRQLRTMPLMGVFLIGLAVAAVGMLGCQDGASSGQGTSASPGADDVIVRELAAKYQAIILRQEDITYTLQAQERLIFAGKPTLFSGYVDDVFDRNGKLFVRFSSSYV